MGHKGLLFLAALAFFSPHAEAARELRFTHTYVQRFYGDRIFYAINITNVSPMQQTVRLRGGVVITDFPPPPVTPNTVQGSWVGPPNPRLALAPGVTGPDAQGFYRLCPVPPGGAIGCTVSFLWSQSVMGGGSGFALGNITVQEDRGAVVASGGASTRFDCFSNNIPDCRAGPGAVPSPIQDNIVNLSVQINGGRPF